MIQRIQTIWLILGMIFTIACLCLPVGTYYADGLLTGELYNLMIKGAEGGNSFMPWPLFAILLVSLPLALVAIFAYKNRKFQMHLCQLCMLLMLGWYIVAIVISRVTTSEALGTVTFNYAFTFPFISMVMYFLAKRGIMKDEKLVRSSERFRD